MVAGRVKAAMGFQKSPATPKAETPRRSSSSPASSTNSKSTVFSRSFGIYFPRSSAQVQPRPPDVAELLRLVEELQERESRLRTELLEQKLLKETVAIVPFLESEISFKNDELGRCRKTIEILEAENKGLRIELEFLRSKIRAEEEDRRRKEKRVQEMAAEIENLRRAIEEEGRRLGRGTEEMDECSSSLSQMFQGLVDASSRSSLVKNVRKRPKSADIAPNPEVQEPDFTDVNEQGGKSERALQSRRHKEEISKPQTPKIPKPPPLPSFPSNSSSTTSSSSSSESTAGSRSRAPNLTGLPPIPPPLPAGGVSSGGGSRPGPPPPPPPPPLAKGARSTSVSAASVRRVPEVVEFYHSLMRRDSKRDSGGGGGAGGIPETPNAANARDMIGEIENRSAHLLAIKTDVETHGDFIRYLIKQVETAAFTNIEDVVAFVKWLDDELTCLVDERAVLKHFDWPEHKADALREAAFGYRDLRKLESQALTFRDDTRQPCASALKKMQAVFEKLEHGIYNLARMREGAMKRYRSFQIPWEWMLDNGIVNQIKLASVKLAMKYMKRVSSELEAIGGSLEEEELILQGVRFAFRVHQFAGGFDIETMRAFQELKDKACSFHIQSQNPNQQQQQKLFCKTVSC
ncbi:protein INCREASED PETAL GROWTH ANISOTROPY 1 [Elaeis guineensis]|uniref:Protein CHUP1, chloroplastic n=1 Tax=Elaeis guineensis var. tenera TaxID=51953 RepID=A0A6I9QNE3_ELAGV|nr:protein CHUP1, chloroplastic [Elaeis guineensis]